MRSIIGQKDIRKGIHEIYCFTGRWGFPMNFWRWTVKQLQVWELLQIFLSTPKNTFTYKGIYFVWYFRPLNIFSRFDLSIV